MQAAISIFPAEANVKAQLTDFFATICHEIRTPVAAIIGAAQLITNPFYSQQTKEHCAEIVQDSARMLEDLIEDMMEYSRFENGNIILAREPFDFLEIINQLIHVVTPKIEQKGLRLDVSMDKFSKFIIGDSLHIRQIILNLLNNAVKFTEEGTIGIDAGLVTDSSGGSYLKVAVTDTGCGIAVEDMERIFEKYTQLDNKKQNGLGLGLSLARELARLMDGDIIVESELGKGSRFTLIMPLPKKINAPGLLAV